MYDRILVPVDGSHFSEEVIPYALGIARAVGAKLALLRITENDSKRAEAESYVHALAARFEAEGGSIASSGDVSHDIVEEAERVPRTLVAITSHGRGGILTAMLGSVAREIVHASHAPVLVYRPDGEPDRSKTVRIKTVLLPLDGTRLSESAEAQAVQWALALGAGLTVVQVLPANTRMDPLLSSYDVLDSSYVSAHARAIARELGIRVDWEVLYGDPVDSIAHYLDGRRDVLAVMATRERSALQAAVLGSVTSGMVHKAGTPIVVHAPGKTARAAAPRVPVFRRWVASVS